MRRRRFLAAGVAASTLPLAGCAARETTLHAPEIEREADETHVVYRHDDERVAVVSYLQRQPTDSQPPYGLRLTVSHAESTTIDALRVELDTASAQRPKPEVYLKAPEGHPYPEIHYHTDLDSGATVVDVPDTGTQGSGTTSLEFLVVPQGEDSTTVRAETAATLTGLRFVGQRYELSDAVEFELAP